MLLTRKIRSNWQFARAIQYLSATTNRSSRARSLPHTESTRKCASLYTTDLQHNCEFTRAHAHFHTLNLPCYAHRTTEEIYNYKWEPAHALTDTNETGNMHEPAQTILNRMRYVMIIILITITIMTQSSSPKPS